MPSVRRLARSWHRVCSAFGAGVIGGRDGCGCGGFSAALCSA